jgi:hypothetical protein
VSFSTGWVNGALQKAFAAGTNAPFVFCVGDETLSRPVSFTDMDVALQEAHVCSCVTRTIQS